MYIGSFRELTDARPADVAIVDLNGTQLSGFDQSRPSTSVITSVPASITSVTLLAANAARRQFFINNVSGKILRVAFAATASTSAYTILIAANGAYESPLNGYTGLITGIWAGTGGTAIITEVTT
jgi:hypothetical protein